jgi:hypothetical protein
MVADLVFLIILVWPHIETGTTTNLILGILTTSDFDGAEVSECKAGTVLYIFFQIRAQQKKMAALSKNTILKL